jgi:hypothetical protein
MDMERRSSTDTLPRRSMVSEAARPSICTTVHTACRVEHTFPSTTPPTPGITVLMDTQTVGRYGWELLTFVFMPKRTFCIRRWQGEMGGSSAEAAYRRFV